MSTPEVDPSVLDTRTGKEVRRALIGSRMQVSRARLGLVMLESEAKRYRRNAQRSRNPVKAHELDLQANVTEHAVRVIRAQLAGEVIL